MTSAVLLVPLKRCCTAARAHWAWGALVGDSADTTNKEGVELAEDMRVWLLPTPVAPLEPVADDVAVMEDVGGAVKEFVQGGAVKGFVQLPTPVGVAELVTPPDAATPVCAAGVMVALVLMALPDGTANDGRGTPVAPLEPVADDVAVMEDVIADVRLDGGAPPDDKGVAVRLRVRVEAADAVTPPDAAAPEGTGMPVAVEVATTDSRANEGEGVGVKLTVVVATPTVPA